MPGVTGEVQVLTFLYACGLGFLLGVYYELFRTMRLFTPPTVLTCIIQDVFFCLSAAMISFFFVLGLTDGVFYPYVLFGELLGFAVFYGTVGNVLHAFFATLCRMIRNAHTYVKRKFLYPIGCFLMKRYDAVVRLLNMRMKKMRKKQKKTDFFSKKT